MEKYINVKRKDRFFSPKEKALAQYLHTWENKIGVDSTYLMSPTMIKSDDFVATDIKSSFLLLYCTVFLYYRKLQTFIKVERAA